MNADVQQLAQTLLASKLAASQSEAQRMAKEMLGVAEKVHADNDKDHIYAVEGYSKESKARQERASQPITLSNPSSSTQSAAAPNSQPTPSPTDAAAFSSPDILTAQPHPNMPQQQDAAQQATTSPSPDSASVDQGGVVSSPAQESSPSPSSWADESSSHNREEPSPSLDQSTAQPAEQQSEPEPVGVSLNTETAQAPKPVEGASQQANMLAQDSLRSTEPRPEDQFASQFQGKTLAELSNDAELAQNLPPPSQPPEHQASQPAPEPAAPEQQGQQIPGQQTQEQSPTSQQSDFLHQSSESEQHMNTPSPSSSLDSGWPEGETAQDQEAAAQEQQQPAPEPQPEQKREGFTEEEKKLQKEVDLAKVFNFGNR